MQLQLTSASETGPEKENNTDVLHKPLESPHQHRQGHRYRATALGAAATDDALRQLLLAAAIRSFLDLLGPQGLRWLRIPA